MCSGQSAEAPEFFLHHGFIDKTWADRQKQGATQKFAYFHTIKQKMVAIDYYPKDLVDNDNLPGGVRVCYDDPTVNSALKIRQFLKCKIFFYLIPEQIDLCMFRVETSYEKPYYMAFESTAPRTGNGAI